MSDITYAKLSDLTAIANMEQDFFSDAMSYNLLKNSLKTSLFLVVRKTDRVVGYILCQCILDEMEILRIAVLPEYRRCGYGRMLLEQAKEAAMARDITQCFLEVRESNINAISLYTTAGFEQYGRRSRFYRQPDEDALLMKAQWSEENHENIGH